MALGRRLGVILALAGVTLAGNAVASDPIVVLVVPRAEARATDWRHIEYRLVAELRSVGLDVVKQSLGPSASLAEQSSTPWRELLVGQRAVALVTARRVNGWLSLYVLLPHDRQLRPVQARQGSLASPGQPEEQILAAVEVVNEASLTLELPRAPREARPPFVSPTEDVDLGSTSQVGPVPPRGAWTARVGAGAWNSASDGSGFVPAIQFGLGRRVGVNTHVEVDAGFTPWSQATLASVPQRFASLGLSLLHDLWRVQGFWPSLGFGPVVLLAVSGSSPVAQSRQRSLAVFGGAFKAVWPLPVSAALQLRPGIGAMLTQPLETQLTTVSVTNGETTAVSRSERQAWLGLSLEGVWAWN